MKNNQNLKLICSALELNRAEITDIVKLGGGDVSKNRVRCWMASVDSTMNRDGSESRFREMSDAEFSAFCVGLKPFLEKQAESEKSIEIECDECGYVDVIKKSDFSEMCPECRKCTLVVNQYDY